MIKIYNLICNEKESDIIFKIKDIIKEKINKVKLYTVLLFIS